MATKIFDFDAEMRSIDERRRWRHDENVIAPPSAFSTEEASTTDLATVKNKKVRSQAEEEAGILLQKIVDSQNRLEQYQADVEKAKNIPNNIFYSNKIEEQRRINEQHIAEILKEQNDLIRGGIVLTIQTIEFAGYLGESLAQMIDNGFRTRDGHFQRLSGQTRELASSLLYQIQGMKSQMEKEAEQK